MYVSNVQVLKNAMHVYVISNTIPSLLKHILWDSFENHSWYHISPVLNSVMPNRRLYNHSVWIPCISVLGRQTPASI